MSEAQENWGYKYFNELIGTFILILLGDGAVVVNILTGGFDLFGVSILWGFAVMFAVYWVGGVSEGHINPAVTIANAVFRDFPWRHVPGYIASQVVGAFLGAVWLLFIWSGYYASFAQQNNITRGAPNSAITAMTLWTFFPNPAFAGVGIGKLNSLTQAANLVSYPQAFLSQAMVTAVLVAVIFALTDDWNPVGTRETPAVAAALIGLARRRTCHVRSADRHGDAQPGPRLRPARCGLPVRLGLGRVPRTTRRVVAPYCRSDRRWSRRCVRVRLRDPSPADDGRESAARTRRPRARGG